jgi:hypothetical protein
LELSEKFKLNSLKILTVDFLTINLEINNVCLVLKEIESYNCTQLYQDCIRFIDVNIKKVLKTEKYLELPENLIIEIIKRDELCLKKEEEILIFHSIHNWLLENSKSNFGEYKNILNHIRFPLMSKSDLSEIVEPKHIVPQELLMEAYKHHLVPSQSIGERFNMRTSSKKVDRKTIGNLDLSNLSN